MPQITSMRIGMLIALISLAIVVPNTDLARAEAIAAASISSIDRSTTEPGAIDVKGKAAPRVKVNVEVISDENGPLLRAQTQATEAGEWSLTIGDASFPDGAYTLRAIVQDSAGLLGPVTEVRGYKVQPKPLLSIKGVAFGWLDAFLLLLFAMLGLAAIAAWYYEHHKRRSEEHILMTERDINSMSFSLMEEVDRLGALIKDAKGMDPHMAAEAEYLLKNQHSTLQKMQGYLSAGVEKMR